MAKPLVVGSDKTPGRIGCSVTQRLAANGTITGIGGAAGPDIAALENAVLVDLDRVDQRSVPHVGKPGGHLIPVDTVDGSADQSVVPGRHKRGRCDRFPAELGDVGCRRGMDTGGSLVVHPGIPLGYVGVVAAVIRSVQQVALEYGIGDKGDLERFPGTKGTRC